MNHYEAILVGCSLAAYIATALLYIYQLFGRRAFWGRPTLVLLIVGLVFHFAYLVARGIFGPGLKLPIANVFETLSFSAWCLVLVFVLVEARWRLTALGAIILPLAFVGLAVSFFALHRESMNTSSASLNLAWLKEHQALLGVHVTLVLMGYAAFMLASCAALAYLLQNAFLKSKRLQGLSRQLPPVQVSDEAAYRLTALGFPIFTLGLVIGVIWAYSTQPRGWILDPKIILSGVTWLVFVIYLHARMASGWKGRKAAALLLAGFCCTVITYVLAGLLKGGWHRFL